jgi:hypothetical protein
MADLNTNNSRYTLQSYGDLTIKANDARSTINNANATTVAVAGGSGALSGGGASVDNIIANSIGTAIIGAIDLISGIIGDSKIRFHYNSTLQRDHKPS